MAGKIATAAQSIAVSNKQASSPMQKLKGILATEDITRRLKETMADNAGAFSASIVELFSSDEKLRACDPGRVVAECIKAASLKLPINKQLGFAYVIPYKNEPQFQLGYKGYIQLAQRSGAYRCINTDIVYEGELLGRNKLTGEIDLSGIKVSDEIIGYFAHIELLNGYKKTLYMSKDEVLAHAQKRSKSYHQGSFSGTWKTDFDAMAMKTCLRLLISKYGIMSVDMARAIVSDYSSDDILPPEQETDNIHINDVDENGSPDVDIVTGEVIINA